jgi:hypothetical protein
MHTYTYIYIYIYIGIAELQGAQEISPGTGIYYGGERDAVEGHCSVCTVVCACEGEGSWVGAFIAIHTCICTLVLPCESHVYELHMRAHTRASTHARAHTHTHIHNRSSGGQILGA